MRFLAALGMVALMGCALAQTPEDPRTIGQQVSVIVERGQVGADVVSISLLEPQYPPDLLESQIMTLATSLGTAPRGLSVQRSLPEEPDLSVLNASFGIVGLLDAENGSIRLQELIHAFLGAPEPYELQSFHILLPGFTPTEQTVRSFRSETVALEGEAWPDGSLEYRVLVTSQDPSEVRVPGSLSEVPQAEVTQTERADPPLWPLILSVVGATLGVGVVAYLIVLSSGSKSQEGKRRSRR